MFKIVLFMFLSLLLIGCVPKQHIVTPAVNGIVLDSKTNLPIQDVIIDINKKTDDNGEFELIKEYSVGIVMIGISGSSRIERRFKIEKKGYQTINCDCDKLTYDAECKNEIIFLTKNKEEYKKATLNEKHVYGLSCRKDISYIY